jgi:transposase InsO family protein
MTDEYSEELLIQKRLKVLKLAEELGNVTEACRRLGISRTQFYVYKQRYETQGIDGLRDQPPIHHSHPDATPPDIEDLVLQLSLNHPAWGCDRLSESLDQKYISLSSQTVQNILNRHGMGTRRDRRLKLEKRYQDPTIELTTEQIKFLEKQNPAFRERGNESSRPGEILSQYMFSVGTLVYVRRVYLHAVVDTYSNYAFGILNSSKRAEAAVAVLQNNVLPFFDKCDLIVEAVLTNNGREFCGTETHPYEQFLANNGIEHWHSRPRKPHTSGFLARFRTIVLSEFFGDVFRTRFYRNVDELQKELNTWFVYYNTVRSHQGYPNMGLSPLESINEYLGQRKRSVNSELAMNKAVA